MKTSYCLTLLLSGAVLSLSACNSFLEPSFMPSGYKYHAQNYKTPSAEEANSLDYKYTKAQGDGQDAWNEWKVIASDIVHQLEISGYITDQGVFLSSPDHKYEILTLLDHALREEFRANGHHLVSVPDAQSSKIQIVLHNGMPAMMMQTETDTVEGEEEINEGLYVTVEGLVEGHSATLIDVPYKLPTYGKAQNDTLIEKLVDDMASGIESMKGYHNR